MALVSPTRTEGCCPGPGSHDRCLLYRHQGCRPYRHDRYRLYRHDTVCVIVGRNHRCSWSARRHDESRTSSTRSAELLCRVAVLSWHDTCLSPSSRYRIVELLRDRFVELLKGGNCRSSSIGGHHEIVTGQSMSSGVVSPKFFLVDQLRGGRIDVQSMYRCARWRVDPQ